jgi:serralysin
MSTYNSVEFDEAPGDTTTTLNLTIGTAEYGRLTPDDHDWYRVHLEAGTTYTFAMVGISVNNVADTRLRLWDANGINVVAYNDDGLPNRNSIITYTPNSTGYYYLDAHAYSNFYSGEYGISASSGNLAFLENEMGAGLLDSNYSWTQTPGTGVTVTYGFRSSAAHYDANFNIESFSRMTWQQIEAVEQALAIISEVSGIKFQRVNPNGYTDNATILFANFTDWADDIAAYHFPAKNVAANDSSGDVWINTAHTSMSNLPSGSHDYLHILSASLSAVGVARYGGAASVQFDSDTASYSVTSPHDDADFGGSYARTPMIFDMLALQNIYGANMTTRTGDTVYGFNSNAGSLYRFTKNKPAVFTIWDAGGNDTFDASGYSQSQFIDLSGLHRSNIGGLKDNIGILPGAMIENAIGGSGNDILYGNQAINRLEGRGGNDTYYVQNAKDKVIEAKGAGVDHVFALWVDFKLPANVERLTLGVAQSLNHKGTGNSLNNKLTGNDVHNVLDGGAGADTMAGKKGNDTYIVDNAGDKVIEGKKAGIDTVKSSVNFTLPANVEKLVLTGTTNINGVGNELANTITGNSGKNTLNGGAGNDKLNGGAGNDKLNGGNGKDSLIGGTGNDTLQGAKGNDVLNGGAGSDFLDGGAGKDKMTGGAGVDYFRFATKLGTSNVDTITDFKVDTDKIQLDDRVFAAIGPSLAKSEFVANASGEAKNGSQHILYSKSSGELFYDADGKGGAAKVHFATLSAGLALDHLDFLVI